MDPRGARRDDVSHWNVYDGERWSAGGWIGLSRSERAQAGRDGFAVWIAVSSVEIW